MNILGKLIKKHDNSIYSIMKKCTSNKILDTNKFDDLINTRENETYKISSAFLDQFGIDEEIRQAQVPQIIKILEDIYNHNIQFNDLENNLKSINFKTLNIIDAVRAEITNDNYNIKTYETFKNLMYTTCDKEIFKFSLEMTALIGKCEELLDDYLLMGQYEEFSKYISFILCVWKEKPAFLDALFALLDQSEDWGAINYGEMLMRDSKIMADINNQGRILIGTLSRNCIPMEIAFELADTLNIEGLSRITSNDIDLSIALTDLYNTLLFEREPCGGILDFDNAINYLNIYLTMIKESEFEEIKFVGLKDLRKFLDDEENKNEIIEMYDKNTYEKLRNEIDNLLDNVNIIDCLRKLLKLNNRFIFDCVNFISKNKINKLTPDLEKMYLEGCNVPILESTLCEIGNSSIKKTIYEKLKREYSHRTNKEISYINLFGDEFKLREKIIHKMNILLDEDFSDIKIMDRLIDDYNPDIRAKALDVILNNSHYLVNSTIELKIKERLSDSPLYVRTKAAQVCKYYNLKISSTEKNTIINKIREREGNNYNESQTDFEDSLEELM